MTDFLLYAALAYLLIGVGFFGWGLYLAARDGGYKYLTIRGTVKMLFWHMLLWPGRWIV